MIENSSSELGDIKIHKNLIAQVAETVAMQVDGVASLALLPSSVVSMLLSKINVTGIRVELGKLTKIEVPIIVKFGYNVHEVSYKVQEEVLKALSKMLNIDTAIITVKVKGLDNQNARK